MTTESAEGAGKPAPEPVKPQRSLAGRLVLVAAVWSTLALAIAGVFLVSLYQRASERSFDAQLDSPFQKAA